MKKKIVALLLFTGIAVVGLAQNLRSFSVTLTLKTDGGSNYLSIGQKKSYTATDAATNKSAIDLVLLNTSGWSGPKMEWYNMSGKEEKVPAAVRGTATVINAISLDKDQFDKCKTMQDFKRMTSHITNNSFSHYASIGEKEVTYHCFIFQQENGKRGLLWIEAVDSAVFKVTIKMQD